MSNQEVILDIQAHLSQLSSDKLDVIWRLVKLLDSPVAQTPLLSSVLPHEWFDADEFLSWRRSQRDIDLSLELEREAKQSAIWN